jgi:hypothetical protein
VAKCHCDELYLASGRYNNISLLLLTVPFNLGFAKYSPSPNMYNFITTRLGWLGLGKGRV